MILVALSWRSKRLEYLAISLPFSFLKQCCSSFCKSADQYHFHEKLTGHHKPRSGLTSMV